jgi:RNA polymerase sigma factor (sigma-70 family)
VLSWPDVRPVTNPSGEQPPKLTNLYQESSMSKGKRPKKENPDNKPRGEAFERHSEHVMATLDSTDAKARRSPKFDEALIGMSGWLFGMAYFFLRGEPNLARRRALAEEAGQIWHVKMLTRGFRKYLTEGKPFGIPFSPFAAIVLRNTCVDLLRDRVCTLASLDGFSDPRRDPRDPAERRELELACRELMGLLPPRYRDVLRSIYWDGLSVLETSKSMQTNPQNVANWHLRSRRRLGDAFRKRGYWPP